MRMHFIYKLYIVLRYRKFIGHLQFENPCIGRSLSSQWVRLNTLAVDSLPKIDQNVVRTSSQLEDVLSKQLWWPSFGDN